MVFHIENMVSPLFTAHGGREEVRTTLIKPYLICLQETHGRDIVLDLLARTNTPTSVLEDETGWISLNAACEMLHAIKRTLGEDVIHRRGDWTLHPRALVGYVRMLRVASTPEAAYRYLAENSSELTRVGRFDLVTLREGYAEIQYSPQGDINADQNDPVLCAARAAELSSLPRIWGMQDATVETTECLANYAPHCIYKIHWGARMRNRATAAAMASAIVCGSPIAASGHWIATAVGATIAGALGGLLGTLSHRRAQERCARKFEKHRILALERSLELRSDFGDTGRNIVGSILGGKYRIQHKIGSGGIGIVYAAEHIALGSRVAIKILRSAAATDPSEVARLRREAQVQVSIQHPNVVQTLDLDQLPDGSIYIVMELLQGINLAQVLKRQGLLAPGYAVPLFAEVCKALDAAHRLGVVHRDLKPGNIFICDDGTVKVLDFGMSKFTDAEALTQEGYTLGTPEYMSPEQCIGAPVQPQTDLYALGVLMYEALTGDIPIQGQSRSQLLDLHQRAIPPSPRSLRPDLCVPEALEQAVMQCLNKRTTERPASAQELEHRLSAIPLEGLPCFYAASVPRHAEEAVTSRRFAV